MAAAQHSCRHPTLLLPSWRPSPCPVVIRDGKDCSVGWSGCEGERCPATTLTPAAATTTAACRRKVGKEVTLYALFRPEAVAKAMVISTNPNSVLGGQPLGRHYCEVVVKVVIERNTELPRPYGDIVTLADAKSMLIQWPYDRLNVTKASHLSKSTAAGEERRAPKTH